MFINKERVLATLMRVYDDSPSVVEDIAWRLDLERDLSRRLKDEALDIIASEEARKRRDKGSKK